MKKNKKFYIGNEDPINPGEDPIIPPLGDPDITTGLKDGFYVQFDEEINNQPLKIQCTWANCFTEPVWDRGLCIRSYDNKVLKANRELTGIIAITTGNYHITENDVVWLEAKLKFANRRPIGWFRESDIWHAKKGTIQPEQQEPEEEEKKKPNWLAWLITGASVLRVIS
jgi:hypothetical protein